MESAEALTWVTRLLSVTFLMQSIEMLGIFRTKSFQQIWSLKNLKTEIPTLLLVPDSFLIILVGLQFFLSGYSMFYPQVIGFIALGLIHLLVCIRFRGVFNGGSDMMIFVLLTGVVISLTVSPQLGLIYITIHALYSYFKAGIVKILKPEWRQGHALASFMKRSLYADMRNRSLGRIFSYLALAFELSIVSVILFPKLVLFYFAAAIIFHFVIYLSFGLNRFFWVWLSAWPAIIYVSSLLGSRHLG
jgi:hypothetical protein